MTTTTFTLSVQAANTGIPSWLGEEKQWVAVASASNQTVLNALSNPAQLSLSTSSLPGKSYNGACVDQSRGEYLWPANGGHNDYRGNEVFAICLRDENPSWYRLNDRSPQAMVDPPVTTSSSTVSTANRKDAQGHNPSGYTAMFQDGRMRAQHGWHGFVFANNRVWFPHQSSPSGIGYSTPHAWSFDRSHPDLANAPGQPPLAWSNDVGPWKWLGTSDAGAKLDQSKSKSFDTAPPAAYDPISRKIWYCHEKTALRLWASLDTTTEAIQSSVENVFASGIRSTWGVVANDPSDAWRYFIVNSSDTQQLAVLDLKASNPYVAAAWSVVSLSGGAADILNAVRSGVGAVYHKPSKSILIYDPSDMRDGGIVKIRIPDAGTLGTWAVTKVDMVGTTNPSTGVSTGGGSAGGQYAWSKFNIVEDMGDGVTSALVVCMDPSLPTYVYRLPTTEIF